MVEEYCSGGYGVSECPYCNKNKGLGCNCSISKEEMDCDPKNVQNVSEFALQTRLLQSEFHISKL